MCTAVIGCGNYLAGDDAAGLHAVRELKQRGLPDVIAIEAGTPGLNLLEMLEGVDRAVIVDAVISGAPPGTIHRFTDKDLPPRTALPLSLHGFNIIDAIDLGRRVRPEQMPPEIVIIGVEVPDGKEYRVGLSEPAAAAIPLLVRAILEEIGGGGCA